MRIVLLTLLSLLTACRGGPRDASREKPVVAPVPVKCGAFTLSVPGGGVTSHDDEGNVVFEWSGRGARLEVASRAPKNEPPPIVYDESTGSPTPEGAAPKDPAAERRVLERVVENKLKAQGCEFTKDVRADVTWYTCDLFTKKGRARVITSVSEGDMCLAICASLTSDPAAAALCDAIAPAG